MNDSVDQSEPLERGSLIWVIAVGLTAMSLLLLVVTMAQWILLGTSLRQTTAASGLLPAIVVETIAVVVGTVAAGRTLSTKRPPWWPLWIVIAALAWIPVLTVLTLIVESLIA